MPKEDAPAKAAEPAPATEPAADPATARTTFMEQAKSEFVAVLFGSPLNWFLVFIPVALGCSYGGAPEAVSFVTALVALIPLCERLGYVTEQIALHTNETVGGLLNATGGNAGELIISAIALQNGYLRVVQTSLLGSVLSNLLLVLGTSLFVGGLRFKVQAFRQAGVTVNSSLLVMAGLGLILPATLDFTSTIATPGSSEVVLSRAIAICMLVMYFAYLAFQLLTHKHLFEGDGEEPPSKADLEAQERKHTEKVSKAEIDMSLAQVGVKPIKSAADKAAHVDDSASMMSDDEDELELTFWSGILWLAVVVVLVGLLSDILIDTLDGARDDLGIPITFLSAIILPIVGNAAEHAGAVMFAWRDRMDITMGICVGSSTQISVLVMPATVIIAWIMGQPMSLDYQPFEVTVLIVSIFLAITVLQDATGNWLKGAVLMVCYVFIAIGFWVHTDDQLETEIGAQAAGVAAAPAAP